MTFLLTVSKTITLLYEPFERFSNLFNRYSGNIDLEPFPGGLVSENGNGFTNTVRFARRFSKFSTLTYLFTVCKIVMELLEPFERFT